MYYAAAPHRPPGDSGTARLQRRRLNSIPYDYTPYRQPDPYRTGSAARSSFYKSNHTATSDRHAHYREYVPYRYNGSPAVAGVGGGTGEESPADRKSVV